jgi:hypothetical protein
MNNPSPSFHGISEVDDLRPGPCEMQVTTVAAAVLYNDTTQATEVIVSPCYKSMAPINPADPNPSLGVDTVPAKPSRTRSRYHTTDPNEPQTTR